MLDAMIHLAVVPIAINLAAYGVAKSINHMVRKWNA
jgi:hypothetical protein